MIGIALVLAAIAAGPAELLGKLDHPTIAEASGMVQSRRHPGIFWVHNDSGNPPALFAVTKRGKLVREYAVAAPNIDWEDIAIDDQGHLFLGDIGNNGERLPLRSIYRIDEPDPGVEPTGPLRVTKAAHYKFPASGRFDAEGLFLEGNKAVVVAKYRDGREADLFAVPLDPPPSLFRPAEAAKVGSLPGFTQAATGASLSPDGLQLAVCSIQEVRVYLRGEKGGWKPIGVAPCPDGQVEAVAWDGADLIVAGEDRRIHRIVEEQWRTRAARGTRP